MANRLFRLIQKRSDSQLPHDPSSAESLEDVDLPPEEEQVGDGGESMSGSHSTAPLEDKAPLNVALREVRDFLDRGTGALNPVDRSEKDIRSAIAAELLNAIDPKDAESDSDAGPGRDAVQVKRERARQLFMAHGYFDEAIEKLQSGSLPSERAAAANIIGRSGNRLGNVHLIAALFDDALEVRDAATAALAQLGEPTSDAAPITRHPEAVNTTDSATSGDVAQDSINSETQPALVPAEKVVSGTVPAQESIPNDEAKLLLDEAASRKALDVLQLRLDDAANARVRFEREAGQRLETETRLRAEVTARRREEEEQRRRVEEEAAKLRIEEEKKLAATHLARVQADEEAQNSVQEEMRLRLEVGELTRTAEEMARTRTQLQAERRAEVERTRLAEVERARQQAEATHKAELERLRREEETLQSALMEVARRRKEVATAHTRANQETLRLSEEREQLAAAEAARQSEAERLREANEKMRAEQAQLVQQVEEMRRVAADVGARRAQVEAAREKAALEAQQLVEAQARMKAAEEARKTAEAERLRVEAELVQQAEEARRLLEEVQRKAEKEKQQLEEEAQYRAAEQEQRLVTLAAVRERLQTEAQQRTDKERQISSQIESLRIADMQARKRIEDAETRRRVAEENYKLVAEKVQRVEAEASKGTLEEERILAKLEEARRNVAVAAKAAAAQEKRIKEETDKLRSLEELQRHRIEEAARRRVDAEHRLQQERDRLQAEEEARLRASEQFERLVEQEHPTTAEDPGEWHDDPAENLRPSRRPVQFESEASFAPTPLFTPPLVNHSAAAMADVSERPDVAEVHDVDSSQTDGSSVSPTPSSPSTLINYEDEFVRITSRFDDSSPDVRNAAAKELRQLDPPRVVELFTRALEAASPERRRNIGSAIAGSGLAGELIDMLGGESRENTYSALCLLLTMAKAGEVTPLIQAIEKHENVYVRLAAVRLLTLNGQEEIATAAARRRLEGNPT